MTRKFAVVNEQINWHEYNDALPIAMIMDEVGAKSVTVISEQFCDPDIVLIGNSEINELEDLMTLTRKGELLLGTFIIAKQQVLRSSIEFVGLTDEEISKVVGRFSQAWLVV